MQLQLFQADAFTGRQFAGNPAAVVPLDRWLPDGLMQRIAMENNLSETAFYVPYDDGYGLRWFTPVMEVNLCGHATLATAHILFENFIRTKSFIRFTTRSGILTVHKNGDLLEMDFPSAIPKPISIPDLLEGALGCTPRYCFAGGEDIMAVFDHEEDILQMNPDFRFVAKLGYRGIIVTARGNKYDFVSRFFAPSVGVDEDPVTGSAHTLLTPYWSQILGKEVLTAKQVSKRGGILFCRNNGNRVIIGGQAVTYLRGVIYTGESD